MVSTRARFHSLSANPFSLSGFWSLVCHIIADATEKLIEEDLEGEELWVAEDLKVPVYNTEDGAFDQFY